MFPWRYAPLALTLMTSMMRSGVKTSRMMNDAAQIVRTRSDLHQKGQSGETAYPYGEMSRMVMEKSEVYWQVAFLLLGEWQKASGKSLLGRTVPNVFALMQLLPVLERAAGPVRRQVAANIKRLKKKR